MKRLSLLFVIVFLVVLVFGASIVSAQPANPECWGVVTSQLASNDPGAMGQHSSGQGEPRRGLGNLSRDFGFDHISDFGSFLATLDGVDETQCG